MGCLIIRIHATIIAIPDSTSYFVVFRMYLTQNELHGKCRVASVYYIGLYQPIYYTGESHQMTTVTFLAGSFEIIFK